MAICKVIKSNWYFRFVGMNTFIYFALHGKVIAMIQAVMGKLLEPFYSAWLDNPWMSSAIAIMITFITSVLLIIPTMLINRYFPWILGREKTKAGSGDESRRE